MLIPPEAEAIATGYLAAIDALHPGLLVGLYLVGSIALGDFQPGRSDVDFVAVTSRRLDAAQLAPLHDKRGPPWFDGLYVTTDELRRLPPPDARGAVVIDGRLYPESGAERHAVTWLMLARHGIAVRGRPPGDDWIAADLAAAQAHARANLDAYWRPWVERQRSLPITAEAVTWSVLGISRLHALIADGELLSKTAAGRYAGTAFPKHRPIIARSEAIRAGTMPDLSNGRERDEAAALFAFLDRVLADAAAR